MGPRARSLIPPTIPVPSILKQCHSFLLFVCPSVRRSDCPPSCAVLGADLHRKRSRGRDGRQGLHHHLRRSGGHWGAVPWQVREPHQQIRERNGMWGTQSLPPSLLLPGPVAWSQLHSVPEPVREPCAVSYSLVWAFTRGASPCRVAGRLSEPVRGPWVLIWGGGRVEGRA